jgi:hypothetical protein
LLHHRRLARGSSVGSEDALGQQRKLTIRHRRIDVHHDRALLWSFEIDCPALIDAHPRSSRERTHGSDDERRAHPLIARSESEQIVSCTRIWLQAVALIAVVPPQLAGVLHVDAALVVQRPRDDRTDHDQDATDIGVAHLRSAGSALGLPQKRSGWLIQPVLIASRTIAVAISPAVAATRVPALTSAVGPLVTAGL